TTRRSSDHGFEAAEILVGAPVLGEFHASPHELTGILLKLRFEPLEKRHGIGGRSRKARNHIALAERADLARITLHDGVAHGHLPVPRNNHAPALADGENGGAMPLDRVVGSGHLVPAGYFQGVRRKPAAVATMWRQPATGSRAHSRHRRAHLFRQMKIAR